MDTAQKVIAKLTAQMANLIKDNTVLSVILEEQQAEIKRLQSLGVDKDDTIKSEEVS